MKYVILFSQFNVAKPAYTPVNSEAVAQVIIPTATFTQLVEQQVVSVPPTDVAPAILDLSTATAQVAIVETNTPSEGVAYAEIVVDTPTSEYIAPTAVAYVPPVSSPVTRKEKVSLFAAGVKKVTGTFTDFIKTQTI